MSERSSRSSTPTRTSISALPIFNLYNQEWPIYSQQLNSPPAKFVRDARGNLGTMIDSIVSPGLRDLRRAHRAQRAGAMVDDRVRRAVTDAVVFERVRIESDAVVRRAILDKDVVIGTGVRIGVDHEDDRARGFTVTETGITVVGKGVHVV